VLQGATHSKNIRPLYISFTENGHFLQDRPHAAFALILPGKSDKKSILPGYFWMVQFKKYFAKKHFTKKPFTKKFH
tara:strand:- start:16 stop:243 length:228 start_codon:yes stop_codon:yes gene_type:complete